MSGTGRTRPLLLSPTRWPVRWRLAGVSATLTLVILLIFAIVVGGLARDRLTDDFRDELEQTATELSLAVRVDCYPLDPLGAGECRYEAPRGAMSLPSGVVRIVDINGGAFEESFDAPDLGAPRDEVVRVGEYEVATRPLTSNAITAPPAFVQFARDHDELDATIERLWLFLGIGVLAGTLMSTLAGLAVANRAMRPIAALTATARQIASTRDPSRAMPRPEANDEVAELARTLDDMLGELDAARSESQQLMQAQREFVADASHELRTPLTSILANLELLEERLAHISDEEAGEMVESALRSSRRMRLLVGDLLLLARADTGRVSARATCDLTQILRNAASEVEPVAGEHAIEVDAPPVLEVEGNAEELHRLSVNLLDNGIRHTPPGTTIHASLTRRDGSAVLEVADDGPGLPEGMEEQVFSRFVRGAGPADVTSDSGTGLGLAIVRAVASSHGGEVRAGRSERGGARFEVSFPAAGVTPSEPRELSGKL